MKNLKNFFRRFYPATKRLLRSYWPILAIIAIVFAFFWKFFLKGLVPIPADIVVGMYFPWLDYKWDYVVGVPVKNPFISDPVATTYLWREYAVALFKTGTVPLWNPLILSGTPLLANIEAAVFSPFNLFYLFLNNIDAWSLGIIFQPLFAGIFMYIFLRNLCLKKLSSLLGAIIFSFCGIMTIWLMIGVNNQTFLWLPLVLYGIDKIIVRPSYKNF
ncbi:MAG: YfhO family protein, partial [bacterium]|nr:YfhO family protein [bacterium]